MIDNDLIKLPYQIKNFLLKKIIGNGATSIVYESIQINTKNKYACKVISRNNLNYRDSLQHFEQELRIHSLLNHPNICKIIQIIYEDNFIFLFLEYCPNGDLFKWIQKLPFSYNIKIISQLIDVFDYLHNRGITHQDLKPENILLDSDFNVKLSDFGNCGSTNCPECKSFFGTIEYCPPEIFNSEIFDEKAIDIWQIGILAYEVFIGNLPWNTDDIKNDIKKGILKIPFTIPGNIKKLIKISTKINPNERIKINDLINLKINKNDQNKLISSGKLICYKSKYEINSNQFKNYSISLSKSLITSNNCFF